MKQAIRLALLAAMACAGAAQAQGKTAAPVPLTHVYGAVEWAQLGGKGFEVDAQMNSAIPYTQLQAVDIKYAHGEGGMFAQFTVDNGLVMPGKEMKLDLPIVQDQHVRERNGGTEHRPVVTMSFCIGDRTVTTNVTLVPRTAFTAPLQLGKEDAAQFGPIDPTKKHTIDANCAAPTAPAPAPAS